MLPDDELTTLLQARYRAADSGTSFIKDERRQAMQRYNCEPYGDEVKGQSSYITSDVRDTIEWLLPQVIEPFAESENAVEFTAQNAQDVEQAALETAYVREVIWQQNPGFIEIYNYVKDGLLLKNGIIKSWWNENIVDTTENFDDRDFLFYQQLVNNPDYSIDEVTIKIGEDEYDLDSALDLTPEQISVAVFDIRATKSVDKSQVCFKAIPPENFVVQKGWNSVSLQGCPYYCHRDTVKAWELVADGHSKEFVKQIPYGDTQLDNSETVERFRTDGGISTSDDAGGEGDSDWANRDITIYEHYILGDLKGNGKVEFRMIKCAGPEGDKILSNDLLDETDEDTFSVWTPTINPHKHYGLSTADLTVDKQLLKTNIMRRTLDSLYHSIHPAKNIMEKWVYKEDFLYNGPGAVNRIREGGPADAITPMVTPFVGQNALPLISLVDDMRAASTGVSGTSQALDMKALADSTNLVGPMVMSQDLMRVKMVIRTFAETGFKSIMRRVHSLARKYDRERMFRYNGEFKTVNPQEWNERSEFTIKVGVGYVEKMQRVQAIGAIIANQTQILAVSGFDNPLVTPANYRISLIEQAKLAGYTDADKFYSDPANWQPPQPPENPLDEAVEVQKAQTIADLHKQAADNALKLKLAEMDDNYKRDKLQQDYDLTREELALKYGHEFAKSLGEERPQIAPGEPQVMVDPNDPNALMARVQTVAEQREAKRQKEEREAQQREIDRQRQDDKDFQLAQIEGGRSDQILNELSQLKNVNIALVEAVNRPKKIEVTKRDPEGKMQTLEIKPDGR